jgi:hypothetical protein
VHKVWSTSSDSSGLRNSGMETAYWTSVSEAADSSEDLPTLIAWT